MGPQGAYLRVFQTYEYFRTKSSLCSRVSVRVPSIFNISEYLMSHCTLTNEAGENLSERWIRRVRHHEYYVLVHFCRITGSPGPL